MEFRVKKKLNSRDYSNDLTPRRKEEGFCSQWQNNTKVLTLLIPIDPQIDMILRRFHPPSILTTYFLNIVLFCPSTDTLFQLDTAQEVTPPKSCMFSLFLPSS
jgi:hypothetical protein